MISEKKKKSSSYILPKARSVIEAKVVFPFHKTWKTDIAKY